MRSIWKGAVSFGLVSIAVKLYSATEEKDIRFHQVHAADGGRIRYQRVCSVDGKEVSYDEIVKGYDLGGGELVMLTDADFADLPLATSHAIDVLEFVPAEQVDPIYYAKSYYLEPDKQAAKPYVLLRDALTESDRVAIVKVALRQREQLATLRVREGVLVLNTMLWPDEVRTPAFGFLDEDITARSQELAMASSLIDSMTGDFDPTGYTDDYRAALQEIIDAKVQGREVVQPEAEEAAPTAAVDLMAALRASVDRARAARGEEGERPSRGEGKAGSAEPTPIGAARSATGKAAGRTAQKRSTAAGKQQRAGATPAEPAQRGAVATKSSRAKATAGGGGTTAAKGGAGKAAGNKATGSKAAGAKATGAKATGGKAAPAKATGAKASSAASARKSAKSTRKSA